MLIQNTPRFTARPTRPSLPLRFGNRDVKSSSSISLRSETVFSVKSSSSVDLNGTIVQGPVSASSSIEIRGGDVKGPIEGRSSVTLMKGAHARSTVNSSGSMSLYQAVTVDGDAESRSSISMTGAEVSGNLNSRGSVEMSNATVKGNVNTRSSSMELSHNSRIGGTVSCGSLRAQDAVIDKAVETSGSTDLENTRLGSALESRGQLTMVNSSVNGKTVVNSGSELRNSSVQGDLTSRSSLSMQQSTVTGNVEVKSDAQITENSTVGGNLDTNNSLTLSQSVVTGKATSNSSATLKEGARVGVGIESRGELTMRQSHVTGDAVTKSSAGISDNATITGDLSARSSITLQESQVDGNVTTDSEATVKKTTIGKTLTARNKTLTLDQVTVGALKLKQPPQSVSISGVSMSGYSGSVISDEGIMVGPGSMAQINGYTIRATAEATTVSTPDGSVYVNGDKTKGTGPATFAEYRKQNGGTASKFNNFFSGNSDALPPIAGPGWKDEGKGGDAKTEPEVEKPKEITQTVILKNGTLVKGDIEFESGYGKIIVEKSARFDGKLIGEGEIERQ